MSMPTYSDGFPLAHGDNFEKWLAPFVGQPVAAIEVGSWEGRSALWLMENILTHPRACLHCVDTWRGEETQQAQGMDFALKERNFLANTAEYRKADRIVVWKGESEKVLPELLTGYAFAYIDGDHRAPEVLMDALLVWRMLSPGGVAIFDDYGWTEGADELRRPKIAIDAFLSVFKERLEILDVGYQVAVRKKE